jgi:hypothetical protein
MSSKSTAADTTTAGTAARKPAGRRRSPWPVRSLVGLAVAGTAMGLLAGPAGATVNHNLAAQEYVFSGAYAGCTLWVGDQYRADGQAQGEADIWCPSYHTYRMRVYLEFSYSKTGAGQGLLADNVAGTPVTSYGEDATTGGVCGYSGYWTTYVSYSIDGSPYSGWYQSTPNSHYVAAAC